MRAHGSERVTRTIAYLRVSTEKQADRGVSLDAQRVKVEQYAALYELEIVEIITDAGLSASTLERPGLQRALGRLRRKEADALLVVKLDRLTRSVRDLGDLIAGPFAPGKAALLSVSEQFDTRSAAGRMVMSIMAVVSQWEREAIGERTSAAMQHMKAQGEYTGGAVPYGYKLDADERLESVPEEQAVIVSVRELRAGRSLRAVAAELAARGMRNRAGGVFGPAAIAGMLT